MPTYPTAPTKAGTPPRPKKRSFFKASSSSFKATHPRLARMAESQKIKLRFPDRVPVIVERADGFGCGDCPNIDKNKFLIPANLTVGQLVLVIRRRIGMSPQDALFVFVSVSRKTNSNGGLLGSSTHEQSLTLPPTSVTLAEVFEQSKDEDGFLYVKYAGENVFGAKGGASSSSSSSSSGGGGVGGSVGGSTTLESRRRPPSRSSIFSPTFHSTSINTPSASDHRSYVPRRITAARRPATSSAAFPPPPSSSPPSPYTPSPYTLGLSTSASASASELALSKPGVGRRLRTAVANRRAKKRAAKEAKLLEASAAAHRAFIGTADTALEEEEGLAAAAAAQVAIKSRYTLSKAEREELKRLRQPMLGTKRSATTTTATATTTHSQAFRNYGTITLYFN